MSTFTTVVETELKFNVESYSIYHVVDDVMLAMLNDSPRGAKCRRSYSLADKDGGKFLVCNVIIQNMKGTEIGYALVISEQPEVAGKRGHANRSSNEFITCRRPGCGSQMFYTVDRSLDYENHICAVCGETAHTLTETGASA